MEGIKVTYSDGKNSNKSKKSRKTSMDFPLTKSALKISSICITLRLQTVCKECKTAAKRYFPHQMDSLESFTIFHGNDAVNANKGKCME